MILEMTVDCRDIDGVFVFLAYYDFAQESKKDKTY